MSDEENLEDMVFTIVRQKKREGFFSSWSYEELFSEGYIQALKLKETYDPEKKKLFNYLMSWLPLRISDGLRSFHGWTRNCPDYKDKGLRKFHKKETCVDSEELDKIPMLPSPVKEEIPLDFLNNLSEKEREVLGLYLRGMTLRQIGDRYQQTESAICQNMRSIRKKGIEYEI